MDMLHPAAGGSSHPTLPEVLERLRERSWEPLSTAELRRAHAQLILLGHEPNEGIRWLSKLIGNGKLARDRGAL